MNILVTGGTGFIGAPLCRHLLDDGHAVMVFSRQPETVAERVDVRAIAVPALVPDALPHPPDVVINLAGEGIADRPWSDMRKRLLKESRIGVTHQLIQLMEQLEKPSDVLISGSAVGYYGNTGERVITEDSPPGEDFASTLCQQWEAEALKAEALGVRVVLLRTGLVVGPGGGFLKRMLPPFRFGLGGPIADGRQYMPWIHRDDVIGIIDHLVHHDELRGVFNVTAPAPASNGDFSNILGEVLGRPSLLPMPAVILRTLFGEMANLLLGGQNAIPQRLQQESAYTFRFPDLKSALKASV